MPLLQSSLSGLANLCGAACLGIALRDVLRLLLLPDLLGLIGLRTTKATKQNMVHLQVEVHVYSDFSVLIDLLILTRNLPLTTEADYKI